MPFSLPWPFKLKKAIWLPYLIDCKLTFLVSANSHICTSVNNENPQLVPHLLNHALETESKICLVLHVIPAVTWHIQILINLNNKYNLYGFLLVSKPIIQQQIGKFHIWQLHQKSIIQLKQDSVEGPVST